MDTLQEVLDTIWLAILKPSTLTLIYDKGTGDESPRRVEPFALYVHPTTDNLTLDCFQWSGDSESKRQWTFKPLLLAKIKSLELHKPIANPQLRDEYKPDSPRYSKALVKR